MTVEPALIEALLSWISALGVLLLLLHTRRQADRGVLESRMQFLLGCLAAMLALRAVAWLYPARLWVTLAFLPWALLPLAVHLFAEALIRRHLPLGMKVFVAVGVTVFSVGNLLGMFSHSPAWVAAFRVFVLITIAGVSGLVASRYKECSGPERRVVRAILWSALFAIPLIATDCIAWSSVPSLSLGSIGALVFCHVCAHPEGRRDSDLSFARGGLRVLVRIAMVGALLSVSWARVPADLLPAFALGAAVVLLLGIWGRLDVLRERARQSSFLQWLADANAPDLASFLERLGECPVAEDHVVLRAEDLASYDVPVIVGRLGASVAARSDLGRDTAPGAGGRDADEQLQALLDTHGMSHAVLVSTMPPVLLLVNYPQLGDRAGALLDLALVRNAARMAGVSRG